MASRPAAPAAPLRYDPSIETPAPDEAETFRTLVDAMRGIAETTSRDYGHAVRSVHAKSHGLVEGELRVLEGLPPALAQGMFARPGATHRVVMRFSTNPGDLLDDSVSTPRGLAIKVAGVEGDRLPGSEGETTQDLVMANAPAFTAADPKAFLKSLRPLAATTDAPQILKKALSAALRGVERVVEAVGGESATLKSLGGQRITHVLGETFHTQVPLRHGDHVAKLSVAPVSPGLVALVDKEISLDGRPNALRDEAVAFFRERGGEWEVRVQLRTDEEAMPIEDASVPWPEEASPYVAVARITAPPQAAWGDARSAAVDDGLAFSPWHGLEAHRPLGGIMRARKVAYEMSAHYRAEFNRHPIEEPRELGPLPPG